MKDGIFTQKAAAPAVQQLTVYSILFSISFSHLLNDMLQSLIPSIYPLIKTGFHLSFTQIGFITLTFQLTASIFQPFVGAFTDRRPQPFSLAVGMGFSLIGLVLISFVQTYTGLLISVGLIGLGSSIFHPEASKIAYMASGGKRGLAQSIFQVGGNTGSAIGPLLAAVVIAHYGRNHILYFGVAALLAIVILIHVGNWAKQRLIARASKQSVRNNDEGFPLPPKHIVKRSIFILLVLIFSKYIYMVSISSYYTFFLIEKFHVSVKSSQLFLFAFLAASALGTYFGGPLGDKYGRKYVIWFSILGAAPFSLMLPYTGLFWTAVLSVVIGFILSSAFSAILVYAQELMPGKIGMISGLFFGFAFGVAGLGSALLGMIADIKDIHYVYNICSFLPLMGLITYYLPNLNRRYK